MSDAAAKAPSFIWTKPAAVAETGVRGLERGRRVVVPGRLNAIGATGGRLAPRGLVLRLADRFRPG